MKKNYHERKIDERKKFDATKKSFEQFIDSYSNFEIYKIKKELNKRLKNVKKL